MQLQRPEPIPVDNSFNEFVKKFGGDLVSDLMPHGIDLPKNADYLFRPNPVATRREPVVVAELKCLEKELFNNDEDAQRLEELFQKWTVRGAATKSELLGWAFRGQRLPVKCQQDMIKVATRTIETAIRKAKKQIQSTRERFELPQARGLLLLVLLLEIRSFQGDEPLTGSQEVNVVLERRMLPLIARLQA